MHYMTKTDTLQYLVIESGRTEQFQKAKVEDVLRILERVSTTGRVVKAISLMAGRDTLTERIMRDIERGSRNMDALERSIARLPLYQAVKSVKVDTDGKTVCKIAEEVIGAHKRTV